MLIKALEREREVIRQEGVDIGKKEGIQERNRQIAHAMSANGFAPPTIAQLLDLPLPEIEALLSQPATESGETTAQNGSD